VIPFGAAAPLASDPRLPLDWAHHAFALGPASRDALLALARRNGVAAPVVDELSRLPSRDFDDLDQLTRVLTSQAAATETWREPPPTTPGSSRDRFDLAPERVLLVRGPGRSARLAASAVTRELESANIATVRTADTRRGSGRLQEPLHKLARSCGLVIAIGDAHEMALNHAMEYDLPFLTLAPTDEPTVLSKLADAFVEEQSLVAAGADLAAVHWHADHASVACDDAQGMRLRCGHSEPITLHGTVTVDAITSSRGPRLRVDAHGDATQCVEAALRTVKSPLRAEIGSREFTAHRVVFRLAAVRTVRLDVPDIDLHVEIIGADR
jgi:hypothetical protein